MEVHNLTMWITILFILFQALSIISSLKFNVALSNNKKLTIRSSNELHVSNKKVNEDHSVESRKNPSLYDPNNFGSQLSSLSSNVYTMKKPEVLSPAGGWDQMKAAVESGADAVYFGLQQGFNARARASNFNIEEIPTVMEYLHMNGVKGYVVVNVLVFDEEISRLEIVIKQLATSGVDALIVQDLGAVKLAREIAPHLPIHGSTQMSLTDGKGVAFTQKLGVERVVLGRELSLAEIGSIVEDTQADVEVFVHGALCVSYSGQCFSSEAWGGRSANRGQCAQACRMPYGLVLNGTLTELLEDVKYLLSPQDLMAVDLVPELIQAGVGSFKIEGRLKGPEYVALTTRAYRQAVDSAWEQLMEGRAVSEVSREVLSPEARRDLVQIFSRGQDRDNDGLSQGFFLGPRHQSLVIGKSPRHRGLFVGTVRDASEKGVIVELCGPIKRGDGVVFDRGVPEEREEGGSIFEIFDKQGKSVGKGTEDQRESGLYRLAFGKGAVDLSRIRPGDRVWRSRDASFEQRVKDSVRERDHQLTQVRVEVMGAEGGVVTVRVIDKDGRAGEGSTTVTLQTATKRPTSREEIVKAVGSLGDTVYSLSPEDIDIDKFQRDMFIPVSELKAARRLAVEALTASRVTHSRGQDIKQSSEYLSSILNHDTSAIALEVPEESVVEEVQVTPLCRTPEQVKAACQLDWVSTIYLDFLEVHGLREAVALVKASGKQCIVATPRIMKPDEQRLWIFYLRLRADGLLVRSTGFLQQMTDLGGSGAFVPSANATIPELIGDFSLNPSNVLSASLLLECGFKRITPTHDLNAVQISTLAKSLGKEKSGRVEVIAHQHLPIFHTEHCVFCRFLSSGNSYKDCGHPCETSRLHLRGMDGTDNVVLADQGCRNTVFNAKAQTAAQYMNDMMDAGIKHFRVEFVDEPANYVESILTRYRDICLRKKTTAVTDLLDWLEAIPDSNGRTQGATAGSLFPTIELQREQLKKTAYQK